MRSNETGLSVGRLCGGGGLRSLTCFKRSFRPVSSPAHRRALFRRPPLQAFFATTCTTHTHAPPPEPLFYLCISDRRTRCSRDRHVRGIQAGLGQGPDDAGGAWAVAKCALPSRQSAACPSKRRPPTQPVEQMTAQGRSEGPGSPAFTLIPLKPSLPTSIISREGVTGCLEAKTKHV